MVFWIGLVAFLIGCVILQYFMQEKYQHIIPKVMMIVLTFFSAFRYTVGADYNIYKDFFETNVPFNIEPFYYHMVSIARWLGFDFQVIFVVYSIVTSFFIWKAFLYYFKKPYLLSLAILFYSVMLGGWWASLSVIRQSLAIAVFLWASQFIIQRKFLKYMVICFFMSMIHYSAGMLLILYWLPIFNFNKTKMYFIFLGIIIITYFGIVPEILKIIVSYLGNVHYAHYLNFPALNFNSGITYGFYIVLWIGLLAVWKANSDEKKYLIILYSLYVYSLVFFSFSDPLCRMRHYFELFFIVIVLYLFEEVKNKYKIIFISLLVAAFSVIFFVTINAISNDKNPDKLRGNNIIYQFNFKLLK